MTENMPSPMPMTEAAEWSKEFGADFTVLDFIRSRVSANVVMAMIELFWPRLIEVKGCVLLPWAYDEKNFEEWWIRLNGNVSQVEATINHLHLWDLFETAGEDAEPVYEEVGRRLVQTWTMQTENLFPDRRFEIFLSCDPDEYGPTVTLRSCAGPEDEDPADGLSGYS